jgi:hypothetical protein
MIVDIVVLKAEEKSTRETFHQLYGLHVADVAFFSGEMDDIAAQYEELRRTRKCADFTGGRRHKLFAKNFSSAPHCHLIATQVPRCLPVNKATAFVYLQAARPKRSPRGTNSSSRKLSIILRLPRPPSSRLVSVRSIG